MIVIKNRLNWYIRVLFVLYVILLYVTKGQTNRYIFFMLLNVVLAYIPFEISNIALLTKSKIIIILASLFWIIFYPNAPYLLTDFFHLEALDIYKVGTSFNFYLSDWIIFSIITFGILFGYIIGLLSMLNIYSALKENLIKSNTFGIVFISITSLLSGFAIYLGRFPRLHTHYLIQEPAKIFNIIIDNINIQSLQFSVVMALWQIPLIILFFLIKNQIVKRG